MLIRIRSRKLEKLGGNCSGSLNDHYKTHAHKGPTTIQTVIHLVRVCVPV